MSARVDVVSLLREARAKVVIPDRLIRVQSGEPFTPTGSIEIQLGGPSDTTQVGDFAGCQSIFTAAPGNWNAPPAPWRVCRMVWAENPAHHEVINYLERIDAAIEAMEER